MRNGRERKGLRREGAEEVRRRREAQEQRRAGSTRSAASKNMLCVICMCIISRDHKP